MRFHTFCRGTHQSRSSLSGEVPEKKTTHWYLPLDQYEPWLKEWILETHKEWKPNVTDNANPGWTTSATACRKPRPGLGCPVPVEGAEGKVLYVWFDAPIGYISNTIELYPDTWEMWWKDPDTRLVHFIGKDNIVFHCIVFPSMLKAHGDYILPDNVPANEFLNLEGDKISTSKNWAVWLHEYLEEFPGKEDVLRYTLCATMPETKDNDFTWKDFQARNNNELVAILGNFVNRAVVLTHKYFDGEVSVRGSLTTYDQEITAQIPQTLQSLENHLEHFHFREALKDAMNLARLGNKYLADTEPWKVIKTDPGRLKPSCTFPCSRANHHRPDPFLPFSTKKLRNIRTCQGVALVSLVKRNCWRPARLNEPPCSLKIEDAAVQTQVDKLRSGAGTTQSTEQLAASASPGLYPGFSGMHVWFSKMDIRVATIQAAEGCLKQISCSN